MRALHKKKSVKAIVISGISLLLVAAIVVGVLWYLGHRSEPVKVAPVSMFMGWLSNESTQSGNVTADNLQKIYASDMVVFAVCLGHQLMALATGATTEKLKYGHRGANHPVRDIDEGRVYITSQNHGYVVKAESVNPDVATVSHVNVNDGTVEGLKYKNGRIFTVQFHPEASPGPRDTGYLFDRFIEKMEAKKHAEE